jgi:hypothetical protein
MSAELSDVPHPDPDRMFDRWFFSVPKEQMLEYGELGTVMDEFNKWLAAVSTKH